MKSPWEEKLFSLNQELASMKNQVLTVNGTLELTIREMESLKPDIITKCLEDRRRMLARQRGFHTFLQRKEAMQVGLAIGIGSAVLGGLLSKDPVSALNAGVSGFDGLVQGLGGTRWCVSLDHRLLVASEYETKGQVNWVPWENITAVLKKLKGKASAGEKLGSLDVILKKIKAEIVTGSGVIGFPNKKPRTGYF